MAGLDSLITRTAWGGTDFSVQESQRLFSRDVFAVDVVFISPDGMISE